MKGCKVRGVFRSSWTSQPVVWFHLITESDEEHSKPVGTVVEQERVKQLFALDMMVTIDECKVLYPTLMTCPKSVSTSLQT